MNLFYRLATSRSPAVQRLKRLRRQLNSIALPIPHLGARIALFAFLAARKIYYFLFRVLVCEPLFKGACRRYRRRLHTDVYLHWVQGHGDIIVGNDVLVDGRCSFSFAARYTERPTLTIGDGTGIGHGCSFTIGRRIDIGRNCRIASNVWMFDVSGHPSDPQARLRGEPAELADVRPITLEDNVWVGSRSIVQPGVTIGEGSIVSAGAVVTTDVPPYSVVAGNPARRIGSLNRPCIDRN